MYVESLVYRPTFGGLRHGLFTLELRLGGRDAPQYSNTELVGRILKASSDRDPRIRFLTIQDFLNENDNWETLELISSLKDTYEIVADITGYQKPGWTSLAKYTRATIGESPWLMFKADEIYYRPSVEGVYVEPAIGYNNINSMRYLLLSGTPNTKSGQTLMHFLKSTTIPWLTISQQKITYEFQIL